MSQSPETADARPRYESAWNAINRMIREDGSWGGRERNCFHLSCGKGRFIDLSYASGADYDHDGRAFARIDMDGDGDDDLAVRARNGERLRVLRNDGVSPPLAVVRIRVEGPLGARDGVSADAVGSVVELRGAARRSVKHVTLGSGFLSQSTRTLSFGLVGWRGPFEARVIWPNGTTSRSAVRPGHTYDFRYGESAPHERTLSPPTAREDGTSAASSRPVPRVSTRTATWLVSGLRAPSLVAELRGRTSLLVFLSKDCALCTKELRALEAGMGHLRKSGVALLGVTIDGWDSSRPRPPFPLVKASEEDLAAWNVVHRAIWDRRRSLAVPLAFLLDGEGLIQRAYRGTFAPETVADDARVLPALAERSERLKRALPFPGRLEAASFERDDFRIGSAFDEAGLSAQAASAFRAYVERRPRDSDALYNLGRSLSGLGRRDEARQAYEAALAIVPEHVDALNNLGFLLATSGELERARQLFRRALEKSPAHPEASLNLAATYIESGDAVSAISVYTRALDADRGNARLWSGLGFAQYRSGDLDAGIASYRRALELAPRDPTAAVGLANLLIMRHHGDDLDRATEVIEKGLEHAPGDPPLLRAREQALLRRGR